jgi:hypothetical protein
MKTKAEIGIGDPVEVRFAVRPERMTLRAFDAPPQDVVLHTGSAEEWRPATVCSLNDQKIGVAFANGTRMEVARHSNTWRVA